MIDCCCKGHSPYENVAREICFVTRCTVSYVSWVISWGIFCIWMDISICKVSIFMRKLPTFICDWHFSFFSFLPSVSQFPHVDTKHGTLNRMIVSHFSMWSGYLHVCTKNVACENETVTCELDISYLNTVGWSKVWWDYLQWIIDLFKGCAWGC